MKNKILVALTLIIGFMPMTKADEGMWLFSSPPEIAISVAARSRAWAA